MSECDLFNLVSVDTQKHILGEYELKGYISAGKASLTKRKKKLKKRFSWEEKYRI